MKVKNVNDVPGIDMAQKLPGVTMQVLIGPEDGAENFVMRRFTIEPGCNTPYHSHDWEHETLILEGEGALVTEDGEQPLKSGDVVLVPSGEVHQFRNTASATFRILCLVPMKGHG